ncbi:MAG: hypothetical protein AAGD47_04615 [Pseudomonadota bacterium]
MRRFLIHSIAILVLTLLTQIGGLAYLVALRLRRAWLAAPVLYVLFSLACTQIAPSFGRVPLPCLPGGALQMQSMVYCAMNRHYVVPELAETLDAHADAVARRYPGADAFRARLAEPRPACRQGSVGTAPQGAVRPGRGQDPVPGMPCRAA